MATLSPSKQEGVSKNCIDILSNDTNRNNNLDNIKELDLDDLINLRNQFSTNPLIGYLNINSLQEWGREDDFCKRWTNCK